MKTKESTKSRSSLNIRLINLTALFAIVLIASFTAVQVQNQMRQATEENLYRSNLSSLIIHQSIDQTVKKAVRADKDPRGIADDLSRALQSLVDSDVATSLYIVNEDNNIIAQASKNGAPVSPSLLDMQRTQNIIDLNAKDTWSYPFMDRENRVIDTLMPFVVDDKVQYVLKTSTSLGNIQAALQEVYVPILITVAVVLFLSIANAATLSAKIVKPIMTLNEASKQVAKGNLQLQVKTNTNDEIEELATTFNQMTRDLARMKDIAENANPLTKLPGNNIIHEEIDKRIEEKKKFIVIHSDLDNFKVFNDAYGIGEGDKAIRLTADLFHESIEKFGGPEEFIGHEGGDDFVLLTTPETIKPLTDFFLAEFDKRSKLLYSEEDQKRGFILGKERRAEGRGDAKEVQEVTKFPLMSISLAALSNKKKPFESYADITNRMVDIKKKAKKAKGSALVLEY